MDVALSAALDGAKLVYDAVQTMKANKEQGKELHRQATYFLDCARDLINGGKGSFMVHATAFLRPVGSGFLVY